ncbi:chorismate mutase [Magnetospirillum molischianum]|nr:chorismate mutase [Magnetospirillum molischianum]
MMRRAFSWGLVAIIGGGILISSEAASSAEGQPQSNSPPAAVSCDSLDEVRTNIDRIDRMIVPLLAERAAYVAQATKFKQTRSEVVDVPRIERIITKVRALAEERGADPALIERIYRAMIESYIAFEDGIWARTNTAP